MNISTLHKIWPAAFRIFLATKTKWWQHNWNDLEKWKGIIQWEGRAIFEICISIDGMHFGWLAAGFQCVRDDNYLSMNSRNCYYERDGWLLEFVKAHQNLSVKLNVIWDVGFGLEFRSILLNFVWNPWGVFNFGVTDNFWCATFERAVKKYISRSKNNKGLETKYPKLTELLKGKLHFTLRGRMCWI